MDNVPPLFIKAVLTASSLSTAETVEELSSHSLWRRLAADQMARREKWHLHILAFSNLCMGYFERDDAEEPRVYASFDEFLAKDRNFHQITSITIDEPTADRLQEEGIRSKLATIASKVDAQRVQFYFFPRIKYSELSWLRLWVVDSFGLHTAVLNHLSLRNAFPEYLMLTYEGPASTEFLKRMVQQNDIEEIDLLGNWPQDTMYILERLIPQPQLRELNCYSRMTIRGGFYAMILMRWRESNPRESVDKEIVFSDFRTIEPFESIVYGHPDGISQLHVTVDMANFDFRMKFTSPIINPVYPHLLPPMDYTYG